MTLFIGQVFERTGQSEDQDEIPVVTDGEPTTLRKNHHKGVTHVHAHTHTFTPHFPGPLKSGAPAATTLSFKGPQRTLLFVFISVHTTYFYFW